MSQFDNAQQGYDSYEEYLKTHKNPFINKKLEVNIIHNMTINYEI